ncbi:MAG: cation:proton antiporter, partial [Arthrospira sp. SH-MAG29]
SESETPVSALLSGVVVKAGVFPLIRCALIVPEIDPVLRIFGIGTAIFGVVYAVFQKDTKLTLAFSTISQLGFILAAPVVGGFYALTHGLVKSALFLIAGSLPSRSFKQLQSQPINTSVWIPLLIASLSVSGFPLLAGFGAKMVTFKNLLSWQDIILNIAAIGTTIYFAKFIFIPHTQLPETPETEAKQRGLLPAMVILLGGLILANFFYYQSAYTIDNIVKSLVTIGSGWLAYFLLFKNWEVNLSRNWEKLEHIIGGMTIMLTVMFWFVFAVSVA